MLLAGDIGGTKTDLALFTPEGGARAPVAQAEFASQDYPDLESIVRDFLANNPGPVEHASFDVSGPVIGSRAKITRPRNKPPQRKPTPVSWFSGRFTK